MESQITIDDITEMGRNHLAQMKQIFADTVGIINTIIQA